MTEDNRHAGDQWDRRVRLVLIGFGVVAAFFLIAEHRAHVLPYLPWLLLAACPLMHVFMHGGHGHGGHGNHAGGPASSSGLAADAGGSGDRIGASRTQTPPGDSATNPGDRP